MNAAALLNALAVALAALILSTSYLLDGPDEIEAAQVVAADLAEAVAQAHDAAADRDR